MKFEISRLEMLEAAKKAARVAPAKAPVDILNGILLESRDDTAEVFMTATNMEASIQQKLTASVAESGVMLINPRLLAGALSLLPGEFVTFSADKPDVLTVTGGKCVYEINCLPANRYPKPVMPFPEETAKISGICSLSARTAFASAKDDSKPILQCVNVKLRHNAVHAAACDGIKLMLVKDDAQSSDSRDFLLPAMYLRTLASISKDDDVFEIGDIGNEIVFTRENMMFTMRKIPGEYIDTASIVKSIIPAYTAVTDAGRMKEALNTLTVGADNEPLNLIFANGKIILRRNSEYSDARTTVPANISKDTPANGYYYNIAHLCKLFQVMGGKIRLELDSKGMMLIKNRNEVYVQAPQRVPVRKQTNSTNQTVKEAA